MSVDCEDTRVYSTHTIVLHITSEYTQADSPETIMTPYSHKTDRCLLFLIIHQPTKHITELKSTTDEKAEQTMTVFHQCTIYFLKTSSLHTFLFRDMYEM